MAGVRGKAPTASKAKQLLMQGAARLTQLGRDKSGSVVVIAGVMFPVLVGGMGLGAEVGYWYFTQRKVHHAADVSAYAAGVRKLQGEDDTAELKKVATYVAEESGFIPGSVELNTPYAGDNSQLEVILTETPPRLFTALFSDDPLSFAGRAVVEINEGDPACVLALEETDVGIEINGGAGLTMNDCDVASNSVSADSLKMNGNTSSLTTRCAHTVGRANTGNGNVDLKDPDGPCADKTVDEFARKTVDPYADVPEPDFTGLPCDNNKKVGKNGIVTVVDPDGGQIDGIKAKRYCNGLSVTTGSVTFRSGLYVIDGGDMNINTSETVLGAGVTFYLTNGAELTINGGAGLTLSAPTSGPYSGILFFGDRGDTTVSHTLNGGASGSFQGAVYFPGGDVKYAGGASAGGGCTQVIGRQVTFTGKSNVAADCSLAGTRDIRANRGVTIIE